MTKLLNPSIILDDGNLLEELFSLGGALDQIT